MTLKFDKTEQDGLDFIWLKKKIHHIWIGSILVIVFLFNVNK